jgi:hypothetical protein
VCARTQQRQVGTIIEHKTDFYASRVPRKQRQKTLVDEILADQTAVAYVRALLAQCSHLCIHRYQRRKYKEVTEKNMRARKGAFRKQEHVGGGKKKRQSFVGGDHE